MYFEMVGCVACLLWLGAVKRDFMYGVGATGSVWFVEFMMTRCTKVFGCQDLRKICGTTYMCGERKPLLLSGGMSCRLDWDPCC